MVTVPRSICFAFSHKNDVDLSETLFCFEPSQELGLVITGTLPVFNKTKSKDDRNGEVSNEMFERATGRLSGGG